MIKVLMCGNHPSNRGGMTSVISQIREHNWEREGVSLRFIPTYLPGNPLKKTAFFIKAYYRIRQVMKNDRPEILHVHMSYKGSFTRTSYLHRLCRKYGVKDIIHLHGSEFEKWYNASPERKKRQIRALLHECGAIIVLGESWKHVVTSIEPSANVVVISNGVKIPDSCVRWNPDRCQLLYLGVLIPRKGLGDLLDEHVDLQLTFIEECVVNNHYNRDNHDDQQQDKADYRHQLIHIQALAPINRCQLSADTAILFHADLPPFSVG